MKAPLLEIRKLVKSYGSFRVLDELDLLVEEGELFGFLGANGAGKSTTIRCILSLIRPDSGEILSLGKPTSANREAFLRTVGSIIEKPDFYQHLTAFRNLEMSAAMYGVKTMKRELERTLAIVGLQGKERIPVKAYSQGMKQRLGIAQALIHQPSLIILDEPTNGLDPQGIIDLRNIIKSLKHEHGKTVVISSHILSEIEQIVDSFIIIDKGKKLVQGSTQELLSERDLVVTVETDRGEALLSYLSQTAFANAVLSHTATTVVLKADRQTLPSLHTTLAASGSPVYSINSRKRLEDLYLQLTERTHA